MKTIIINITIGKVPLSDLEEIEKRLREVLERYENKRIDINVTDNQIPIF